MEYDPEYEAGSGVTTKVFVGNLSWDTAWQDLKDHMRDSGEVLRADVFKERNGRSKGCGVVEYSTPEAAQLAVANLHDSELMGRKIIVSEYRENPDRLERPARAPRRERAPREPRIAGAAPAASVPGARVFVGNLAWDVAWQDLKDHMRSAGHVVHADVLRNSDGRSKGCGIVEFSSAAEAATAIETLNDSMLKDRPIFVREDREAGRSGRGSEDDFDA